MRKFEIISKRQFDSDFNGYNIEYNDIMLPKRNTKYSAGYDFYIPFDIVIKPNQVVKIPTGIKVLLNNDEFLGMYIRSSLGFKYNLRMCNQVGIIDCDYYNNISNEGHIFVKIKNEGQEDVVLKKNDRYVQGIIQKYYIVDDEDNEYYDKRIGGFGSTNKGEDNNER